ncbi:class I SAM-dependent methyltransferase [Azospirillum halopraeferens]|uniref:class I SAM-dependent methyltransferase n=1 Tax=Azospirillum halopraeferens TaxID=34010 RepID=UPI0003FA7B06|nr:class I SAM-dependent methyltransferase [Azospirillum halopraeferens]
MDWAAGYVVDTLCSPGFYREMAPAYAGFAALLAGRPPAFGEEGPRAALELGCGVGFGTALLAAANPDGAWTGIDFNPDHIAAAEAFRAAAGLTNLTYRDAAFADYRPDPGAFDYAALHGVYSWIGEADAAHVGAILRDGLAVGGVAYVSYNAMPGWAAAVPLRRLLAEHARRQPGTAAERAVAAVAFARTLADAGAACFAGNPGLTDRLAVIAGQDPRYLAHEYLNAAWRPLFHADVAAELGAARLTHVASADPVDAFPDLTLAPELAELVATRPDRIMAETVRDLAINRGFRRDLYARGAVTLTSAERLERLMATRMATLVFPDDLRLSVRTAAGEAAADAAVARPLVDRLWRDGPQPLSAFAGGPGGTDALLAAVAVLVQGGQIHPLARPADERARAVARRFNGAVCEATRGGRDPGFLAAPAIGSGLPAGPLEQAVYRALLLRGAGCDDDAALADAVLPELERAGRPLLRDGRPIADPAERREELRARLAVHRARRRPVWHALGML